MTTLAQVIAENNLPTYLAKKSSLGHEFAGVCVGSAWGDILLADPRLTIKRVPVAKSFDPRGYIGHIVLA